MNHSLMAQWKDGLMVFQRGRVIRKVQNWVLQSPHWASEWGHGMAQQMEVQRKMEQWMGSEMVLCSKSPHQWDPLRELWKGQQRVTHSQ